MAFPSVMIACFDKLILEQQKQKRKLCSCVRATISFILLQMGVHIAHKSQATSNIKGFCNQICAQIVLCEPGPRKALVQPFLSLCSVLSEGNVG